MRIRNHVPLKPYTNYRIGGPASYFVNARTVRDVLDALAWARADNLPVFILGSGTNIIVSDAGYDGLVLRNGTASYSVRGRDITAEAGVTLQTLVDTATACGLAGLEWAGGLPGSVGGAIYGNAGAFGGAIHDVLVSVKTAAPDGAVRDIPARECAMGYRESIFKKRDGLTVISATFRLRPGDPAALGGKVEELRTWRRTKHPVEYGNCGSVFKSVPVTEPDAWVFEKYPDIAEAIREKNIAAAFFIDKCGLKHRREGGITVSGKHPNFLVNETGGATARDVRSLIDRIKRGVFHQFGISLEEEVQYVGFD